MSDGKAQITRYYNEFMHITKIKTFTICYQNTEISRIETDNILKQITINICKEYSILTDEFLINLTSKFMIGGFIADTGLTGRKIIVDTYQ